MDITFYKSQRRRARTALRNYIVERKSQIEAEFDINLPDKKEIKQMSGSQFGAWVMTIAHVIFARRNDDLENYELIDLLSDFVCCENNVTIAESVNAGIGVD